MPTKTPPAPAPARNRGPTQAELFTKYAPLDRQRAAVALATRVLRLLETAHPETAEIALEIAGTSVRMLTQPNGDLPARVAAGLASGALSMGEPRPLGGPLQA